MSTATKNFITVETVVNAPVAKVWESWNQPEHIMNWCAASADWHAPAATNDLREGGSFSTTMAAKDGSFSFDFGGIYDVVKHHSLIEYTMGDGRKTEIVFTADGDTTRVVETFQAETQHSLDMQRQGWQAILDNFKKYTESLASLA
ncbi:MAG: SRPBCC family protein [Chitinophagaceae bacterium]